MKATIEEYRGIEIWFDTHNESFQCDIDDERSIKKSYPAIKKFIDEWKKDNVSFKPFKVDPNPNETYRTAPKGTIIGIRKDNAFVLQLPDGSKKMISKYDEKDYILHSPDNKEFYEQLVELEDLREQARIQHNKMSADIKAKFKIITLRDHKANLL